MPVESLHELLKHELGDLLFAEKTVLKAGPKMAREISNPELRQRLEQHMVETEQQVANIERAFEALGERAKAEKCPGILGIVEEHDEFKREESPSKLILEAFDLGAGLRVEHYEIAAYQSAIALARALGHREIAALLKQNLGQEVAMARFLTAAAPRALATLRAQADGGEGGTSRGASKRGATKRGASKTGASKRAGAGAA
jgi:ferritin-like metal-binding protein YciE